ncbi:hypothetical protein ES705_20557 [subsurface metagenome]
MTEQVVYLLDQCTRVCQPVLEVVALADSIAWQIAKDDGLDGVTLEVWERALFVAERQFDRREPVYA